MLQELIGQGTLQGSLEDFAAPDFFLQTASLCESGVRVHHISELMQSRHVCLAGQVIFVEEDDKDTVCVKCGSGKYSDVPGSRECRVHGICSGMERDLNPEISTGQIQASQCVLDFDNSLVDLGRYPRLGITAPLVAGTTYKAHRYAPMGDYVQCVVPAVNTLCPSPVLSRCRHDFLAAWASAKVVLQNMGATAPYTCVYTCREGTELHATHKTCTHCAPGTYKSQSGTQGQCQSCPAGTTSGPLSGASACTQCVPGKFSWSTTECRDLCAPGVEYPPQHHCFRAVPWYITPEATNRLINIAPCDIQSDLVTGTWLYNRLTPNEHIKWLEDGEHICVQLQADPSPICMSLIMPANVDSYVGNSCRPKCMDGFYRTYDSVLKEKCVPCEFDLARMRALGCPDATFLDSVCRFSENTVCLPCRPTQYEVLDVDLVNPLAYQEADRCIFKCADRVQVGGVWWFLKTRDEIRRIFNMVVQSSVHCIRSSVSPYAHTLLYFRK